MKDLVFNLFFDDILLKGYDSLFFNCWWQQITPTSHAVIPRSVALVITLAASLGKVEPLLLWGSPWFFTGVKGQLVPQLWELKSCEGWWWQGGTQWGSFWVKIRKKSFQWVLLSLAWAAKHSLGLQLSQSVTTDGRGEWWIQVVQSILIFF